MRSELVESKAPVAILRLASAIYPAGVWRYTPVGDDEAAKEEWRWRSGLSSWSWRALEVLRENENGEPMCCPEPFP